MDSNVEVYKNFTAADINKPLLEQSRLQDDSYGKNKTDGWHCKKRIIKQIFQ